MSNCLVTKLGSSIDNAALPKIGELIFKVSVPESHPSGETFCSFESPGENLTVRLSDRTKNILVDGKPVGYTYTSKNHSLMFEITGAGEYYVGISSKYNLAKILQLPICLAYNSDINLEELKYSPINYIGSAGGRVGVYGDISNLSGKDITYLNLAGTKCYGSFEDVLGTMIHLTDFNLGGTEVAGSIEGFVQKQRENGRSSYTFNNGTLSSLGAAEHLTFNGSPIPNQETNTLSWDATTITLNGVTITA